MADSISVPELSTYLVNHRNMMLIDVRRKSDFEQSPQKITGARWHDPEAIADWIDLMPKVAASSCCSSVFTLANTTSGCSSDIESKTGANWRQGPHPGAQ